AAGRAGLRTLLVEEHPTIGVPNHCTGKLSHHAFVEFDIPESLALNAVCAAVFHSPGGVSVEMRRATTDSYVVDPPAVQPRVVAGGRAGGAQLVPGRRTAAARRNGKMLVLWGQQGGPPFEASCRLLVDAEGAGPRLPAALGIPLPRRYAVGLQYHMRGVRGMHADTPEVFFGRDIAPGFFAWLMPAGGDRARGGLCVDPRMTSPPPAWVCGRLIAGHA